MGSSSLTVALGRATAEFTELRLLVMASTLDVLRDVALEGPEGARSPPLLVARRLLSKNASALLRFRRPDHPFPLPSLSLLLCRMNVG